MSDRLQRIGRLAVVAQGLEREGAYNGAKLLRAAMERELVRHAAELATSGAAAVAGALDELVADLGDELPADVAALLPAVADHVRAGRTIPLADAPRARVCRTCGQVFLGEEPTTACPVCAAPPLTYCEMYPIWYLEPVSRDDLLAGLEAGGVQVLAAVAGRSDGALAASPAPGEWAARQVLEHLSFAEGLCAERIGRLLDEDGPNLASRAVWAETPASDEGSTSTDLPASELAARVVAMRVERVAQLRALPDQAWSRTGTHPEWGVVTVHAQAAYFGRHLASHMAQLTAAADGRVPGRRP